MRDAQTLQRCLPSSPVTPTSRHYMLSPHHVTGTSSHPSTPTWNNLLTSTAVSASDFQTPSLAHLVHQGNSVTLSPAPSVDSQSGIYANEFVAVHEASYWCLCNFQLQLNTAFAAKHHTFKCLRFDYTHTFKTEYFCSVSVRCLVLSPYPLFVGILRSDLNCFTICTFYISSLKDIVYKNKI
jgi:hypothetical protein